MLKQWIENFIFGNFYIAICAVALFQYSYYKFSAQWADNDYVFLVFLGTLCSYTFCRLNSMLFVKGGKISKRLSWVREHLFFNILVLILSSVFYTYYLFKLTVDLFALNLVFGLLSSLYALKTKSFSIREIPYLKIILIAFSWLFLTCIFPLLILDIKFGDEAFLHIMGQFCFIISITLPFDLRDFDIDKKSGLKTWPHLFGKAGTVIMSILLMSILLICEYQLSTIRTGYLSAIVAICLIVPILNFGAIKLRNEYYFLVLVDGMCLILLLCAFL